MVTQLGATVWLAEGMERSTLYEFQSNFKSKVYPFKLLWCYQRWYKLQGDIVTNVQNKLLSNLFVPPKWSRLSRQVPQAAPQLNEQSHDTRLSNHVLSIQHCKQERMVENWGTVILNFRIKGREEHSEMTVARAVTSTMTTTCRTIVQGELKLMYQSPVASVR